MPHVVESLVEICGAKSAAGSLVNDEFTRKRGDGVFDLPAGTIHDRIWATAEQLETELVKILQPARQILPVLSIGAKDAENNGQTERTETVLQLLNFRQDGGAHALKVAVDGSRCELLEDLSKFRVGPGKEALDIDDDEGSSPGIESDGRLLFLADHFLDLLVLGHSECLRRLITWCGIYDRKGRERTSGLGVADCC